MIDMLGQRRLVDEVADRVRDKIYADEYVPGDRLRQERLAAEFSVSRTPLREALRMLERDGLVAVSPSRGVQVADAEPRHLLAAYEVREVVGGLAARLAADGCTPELVAHLRRHIECQDAMLEPWNARLWTRMSVAFHVTILEHAGNPVLLSQAPLIRLTAQVFYPYQRLDPARAAAALDEHREVSEAICEGDVRRAEEAARAHVRRTREALVALEPAAAGPGKEGSPTRLRRRRA